MIRAQRISALQIIQRTPPIMKQLRNPALIRLGFCTSLEVECTEKDSDEVFWMILSSGSIVSLKEIVVYIGCYIVWPHGPWL